MLTTKKLAAIALSTATIMSGMTIAAGTAYAAADTNTANDITVAENGNGSTVTGRTFTAYKLASYSNPRFDEKGDKVIGYDLTSAVDDAALRTAIKTAITNADGTVKDAYKDVASIDGDGNLTFINDDASLSAIQFIGKHFYGDADDVYGNNHANKADMRTLADALTKAGLTAFGDPVTGAEGAASFDLGDDDLGLYLIVEGTHAADGQTVSRAMVVGSPFKYDDGNGNVKYVTTVQGATKADGSQGTDLTVGTINLKADKVTVTKDVIGDDKLIGLDSVRTFQIDTNVPNYKTDYQNWTNPVFRIQDNPSDNLTVSAKGDFTDMQNLKVQANTGADGAYEDIDAGKYTVSANAATEDANDFTISLNAPADYSGRKIRVTYDATVNSLNTDTTANHASVDFSNDPYTEDSVDSTPGVDEKVYEADLDLSKVKFNDAATKLAGAEFTVMKDGQPVSFAQDGNTFVVSNRANSGRADRIKFGADTDVRIRGLAADTDANGATYTFTESKAPEGYILGENPVSFSVTIKPTFGKDGELQKVDYSINAGKFANFLDLSAISQDENNPTAGTNDTGTIYTASATIENTTDLSDMPKTGADVLTYAVSAIAAAFIGAAFAVAARRRMNAAK